MTTIVPYVNNNRTIMNGDVLVSGGVIGESIAISATSDFSLSPTLTPALLKYYNVYVITAETARIVTLPSPKVAATGDVHLGWYCRIDLLSNIGTGSLSIRDHLGQNVATLNANPAFGKVQSSVTMTLLEATPLWCAGYGVPTRGSISQIPITNGSIVFVRSNFGKLYSAIDLLVNVNTIVDVALEWDNPTNLVIDPGYYSFSGSGARINFRVAGMYRIYLTLGIDIVLLATLTNIRIRPRVNGATYLTNFTVYRATILPYASGVYWLDCINYFNASDYVEIMVGKSLVSVGSNPTNSNTAIMVEYIGQV